MTRPPRNFTTLFVALLATVALFVFPGCTSPQVEAFKAGAAAAEQRAAELEQVVDEIGATLVEYQAQLDAMADDNPDRESVELLVEQLVAAQAEAQAGVTQAREELAGFNARIENAQTGPEIAVEGVQTVAPFLPSPWRDYLLLAASGVAAYLEARRRREKKRAEDAEAQAKLDAELAEQLTLNNQKLEENARYQETAASNLADRATAAESLTTEIIEVLEESKDANGDLRLSDPQVRSEIRSRMSTETRRKVSQVRSRMAPRPRVLTTISSN